MRRPVDFKRKVDQGSARTRPAIPSSQSRFPASRRVPVQAERSEPQGSLDRGARCEMIKEEGMAGGLLPSTLGDISKGRHDLGSYDLTAPLPFAQFFEPYFGLRARLCPFLGCGAST